LSRSTASTFELLALAVELVEIFLASLFVEFLEFPEEVLPS